MKSKEFKPLFMLMINMFVIMMGIGLVIPILPYYVEAFGATSMELGLLIAVFSFMQFLLAPVWGKLSDKYGRKPLIAIGMFGFAGAEFIFAFATDLWMLFLSRILAGSFGSAIMPAAMAYVSDRTTLERRGHGMGMLGAAMSLGIVVGPGVGGWLAEISLATPFLFAGIAATVAGIISLLILPESLTADKRQELAQTVDNSNQFIQMWHALKSPVGFLLLLVFGLSFGLANFQTIFGMYALHQFGYSPSQVGFIMVLVGVIGAIAQGGLVGRLTERFGDERVVLAALLLSGIGYIVMMLAFDFITVIVTTCIFFLGNSILRPAVNTMISKLAGERQGMIMGLNNSFLSLGNVAGALVAGLVFELNMYLPYSVGALTMFVLMGATIYWLSKRQAKQTIRSTV
ncbi:MFS transporter [Halalkalibacter nanhaiisediminis]|uniref:DHA1 family multidrug resistance protein-like MFS transporter n=1 Tax=Halalkalibacter nanhaiisediminis TaxID=688079 RepID=A0A562QHH7_9BACI|nr:MFS transporter [Halalkalibacter nanhaiisediminis]TWI56207.1 DHA1 family multidrug resistance protein-like MFS transporter [Halalkalibacter nanhaiisediminis]